MTLDLVRDAVHRAARQAFEVGRRQGKPGGTGRPDIEQLAVCQQYAEQLVMPLVEVAIEEAVEQTAIVARAG